MKKVELQANERLDDLLQGGRRIIQNEKEFCFSLDAVLLAGFARKKKSYRVLDLGTGTGVLPLLIADEVSQVTAVEFNPVTAALARRNVELNGLTEQMLVREGDYRCPQGLYEQEGYDLVLANPPYRPAGDGNLNLSAGVATARHELTATLQDVIRAARYGLRFRGYLALVHLPERLGEIMVELHENRIEAKRLQFVQPRADKAPNMVLIEGIAGAAPGGLQIMPSLVVHDAVGGYTEEVLKYYG